MTTNNSKRIGLWLALGTVIALSLLWEIVPRTDASARLRRLPVSGFQLASREVPLTPVEASIYHSATVIKRIYQAGHQRCILLAIDGTRDRHAVHDPRYCFRGNGWTIGADQPQTIPGGTARVLQMTKNGQSAEILFWITEGRTRHASALRAWWQSTLRRLTFGLSGDEPVIFILQPMPGETVNWDTLLAEFPALFDV